jgi:hypothetical protein
MAFVERFLTSCSWLAITAERSARLPLGIVIVIAESLLWHPMSVFFRDLTGKRQAKTAHHIGRRATLNIEKRTVHSLTANGI